MKNTLIILFLLFSISNYGQNDGLNLMPWPQEIKQGPSQFIINNNFSIEINDSSNKRLKVATTKFLRRLSGRTGVFIENGFAINKSDTKNSSLEINFKREGKLEINEDESYQLNVETNKISINATTDIGAIYALETLLQLISNDESNYYFPEVIINDSPRFTWRGLMIDVARHFQPVEVLKRNLDAMAAVKMNVFHWHLTDDQGFRVESKLRPKLHELGSDGLYYTQDQIREVVQYASDRGIRVIPEIDVPGHATAILTAYPEIASKDTVYSIERFSGIFNPTLDPTNEKTYEVLGDLFKELAQLFPNKYIHIGGDENEGKHWDENPKIQRFKKKHNLKTNHDLQTFFNLRLEEILAKYGKSIMGWEEIMTDKMPTTALIHSWKGVNEGVGAGSSLEKAAKRGFKTVLSNGYYIDLMQPVSEHYLVDPIPNEEALTSTEQKLILGGEATMWSELTTSLTIDSRLWPRTAAIAERFWSDRSINNVSNMYKRLQNISFRLEEVGVTHLRNRDVILRNITNNQNIESLVQLTKVYEPIKIYTRNKGGTEYKTYSPFTLFADACSADASDGVIFSNLVTEFLETKDSNTQKEIVQMLQNWSLNHDIFLKIENGSPILNSIEPLSKNLSEISKTLISIIESKKISKSNYENCINLLSEIKKPIADTELIIYDDLKRLSSYFLVQKLKKGDSKSLRKFNH